MFSCDSLFMQRGSISPSVLKSFLEKIPHTIAVLIIDGKGNLIEKVVSKSSEGEFASSELEYIAKMIGLRYKIVDFHKMMSGLEMTINIFRDRGVFVSQLSSTSVIAVITKNVDIQKARQIFSQMKSDYNDQH